MKVPSAMVKWRCQQPIEISKAAWATQIPKFFSVHRLWPPRRPSPVQLQIQGKESINMPTVIYKVGDDVSTDVIYPGRFMATVLPSETPLHAFADDAAL